MKAWGLLLLSVNIFAGTCPSHIQDYRDDLVVRIDLQKYCTESYNRFMSDFDIQYGAETTAARDLEVAAVDREGMRILRDTRSLRAIDRDYNCEERSIYQVAKKGVNRCLLQNKSLRYQIVDYKRRKQIAQERNRCYTMAISDMSDFVNDDLGELKKLRDQRSSKHERRLKNIKRKIESLASYRQIASKGSCQ